MLLTHSLMKVVRKSATADNLNGTSGKLIDKVGFLLSICMGIEVPGKF